MIGEKPFLLLVVDAKIELQHLYCKMTKTRLHEIGSLNQQMTKGRDGNVLK